MPDKKKSYGFTLMEVMLALAILAGCSLLLLVKLPGQAEKQNLENAAARLLVDLRTAHQAAMGENVWYRVTFAIYEGSYRVYQGPGKTGQVTKVKEVELPKGISFTTAGAGPVNELYFYPGGTPSEGKTIKLTDSRGNSRRVIVAPVECRIREE